MTTEIDIINRLRSYVESHNQINSFGYGTPDNISTTNQVMPLLWLNPIPSELQKHSMVQRFEMYVLSILNNDQSNIEQVMSDMLLLGLDVVSYFWQDDWDNGFELNEQSIPITPYMNIHDDLLGGYVFNIEITYDVDLNYCKTPIN